MSNHLRYFENIRSRSKCSELCCETTLNLEIVLLISCKTYLPLGGVISMSRNRLIPVFKYFVIQLVVRFQVTSPLK